MADLKNLLEKVTSLQTSIRRLEFSILFVLVIVFLLFIQSVRIYISGQ
jgi:hypothetical protein